MKRPSRDELRTARLVFDADLVTGALREDEVAELTALASTKRGFRGIRLPGAVQRLAMKVGAVDGLSLALGESIALRRAAFGGAEELPPRFLVRVDEFPYSAFWDKPAQYGTAATEAFHDVLVESGVPYLLAVLPRPAIDYLDPSAHGERPLEAEELRLLDAMKTQGVAFAQHGTTHRTRFQSPRRRSEFGGLGVPDLGRLLESGRRELELHGLGGLPVLVPPFNRFDASQWPELARRYPVVTGGPESVRLVGARSSPAWWGESVYLPSYPPLYANARTILGVLDELMRIAAGCWIPVVLHTAWEIDDGLVSLRQLATRLTGHAVHWRDFLNAVRRSASPTVDGR